MRRGRVVPAALAVLAIAGAVVIAAADGNGDQTDAARTDRWIALQSSPFERTEVTAVRIGRHLYAVGGPAPDFDFSSTVEALDVR